MAILGGGPFAPGADVPATDGVTADRTSFVPAATGRRLLGYSIRGTSGNAGSQAGALILGDTVATISRCAQFEFATNEQSSMWMWPGVDCSNGITIDHIGGSFEVIIYTLDIT